MKIQLITAVALLFGGAANAQTITNYTTADGLLANNVICVDVDANDAIWFGTQDGVSVFDGATWTNHTTATDPGLAGNTIQAIYVANSGNVWAGTDFGISVYDGISWFTYNASSGLANEQIKCITEDANGDIWVGTNSGASQLIAGSWANYGTAEGLPFGGVNDIDVHSNGDVWMGTGLSGISIFDGATFSTINDTDGLIDNRIRATVIDASDNKWVGTSEGITVLNSANTFSMNHTTMFSLPAPDTLNPVEDLEMDSQGIIWAGIYVDYLVTEGGVCAYNGNFWNQYTVADGLVGPVVRALAIDGNDDVWVGTSTGVSKISDPTVGVTDQELSKLHIYPNPTTGEITISALDGAIGSEVVIYDASMKIVQRATLASANTQVNVHHLKSGIYFVENGSSIERLIVK